MKASRTFIFAKLVRNQIVAHCDDDPQVLITTHHRLTGLPLLRELIRKLQEEAREIPIQNQLDTEVLSEIADAQTVLDAIKGVFGATDDMVNRAMAEKTQQKGDLSEGEYITSVTLDPASKWIQYFEDRPSKYPEVSSHDEYILPGIYEHYKGNRYEVIGYATHSETEENMVMYRPLYLSDHEMWVRPAAMFSETVNIEGRQTMRFRRIDEE